MPNSRSNQNKKRYSKPFFLLCWNSILKGNQIFGFFLKIYLPLKKRYLCLKKCLSHWVTVFKEKNVCRTESLCLRKKCLWHWVTVFKKKRSKTVKKTVKNGQKRSVFDPFLYLLTIFYCLFLKHSNSVWQTFVFLNTVIQCNKYFFS